MMVTTLVVLRRRSRCPEGGRQRGHDNGGAGKRGAEAKGRELHGVGSGA